MGMKLPTPQEVVSAENLVEGQQNALRQWLLRPLPAFWELSLVANMAMTKCSPASPLSLFPIPPFSLLHLRPLFHLQYEVEIERR